MLVVRPEFDPDLLEFVEEDGEELEPAESDEPDELDDPVALEEPVD